MIPNKRKLLLGLHLIIEIFSVVQCSLTIKREKNGDLFKKADLPNVNCNNFNCYDAGIWNKCKWERTIYSADQINLNCHLGIPKPCETKVLIYKGSKLDVKGLDKTAQIKDIEFWNYKLNSKWISFKTQASKLMTVSGGKSLKFEDLKKAGWTGQLFKITFTGPTVTCIAVKVLGEITYPFDFGKIFPPATLSSTTTPVTTSATSSRLAITSTTTSTSTTKLSTTIVTSTSITKRTHSSTSTILPSTSTSPMTTVIANPTPSTSTTLLSRRTTPGSPSSSTKARKNPSKTIAPTRSLTKSPTIAMSSTTTGTFSTTTTKPTTLVPPNSNEQGGNEDSGGNMPVYIALGAVSVVVVILLVVVFFLCRRRSANVKGKNSPENNNIAGKDLNNPIYLKTLHSQHNSDDDHTYMYTDAATIQRRPVSTNTIVPPRPREYSVLSTNSNSALQNNMAHPSDNGEYETLQKSAEENEYLSAIDSLPNYDDQDRRPRQESVVSSDSTSGLLSNDFHERERPAYASLSLPRDLSNVYTGLNPIQETYEPLNKNVDTDSTYQGIQKNEEPLYREVYSDNNAPYHGGSSHQPSLNKKNENSADVYAEVGTKDAYSPIQANAFKPKTYAELDTNTRDTDRVTEVTNAAYEPDNFYHVLE